MSWAAVIVAGGTIIASEISSDSADAQNANSQQAISEIQQIANEAQALEQEFLASGNLEAAANIREATAARIAAYGEVIDLVPELKAEIVQIARSFYDEAESLYAPFRADKTAANNAFNQQLAMLGLPNIDGSANAFDPESITSRPSYQFVEEQGNRGVDRSAAARTGTLGGRAVKESARFNAGLASQEFNNEFTRLGNVGNSLNQSAQFGTTGTVNALTNATGIVSNSYNSLNAALIGAIQGAGEAEAQGFENLGALALQNSASQIQLSQNNTNTAAALNGASVNSTNANIAANSAATAATIEGLSTAAGSIAASNSSGASTSTGAGSTNSFSKKRTTNNQNIFG